MPAKKIFIVFMLVILCLLPIKNSIAAPIVENSIAQDGPPVPEVTTGTAPEIDLNSSRISSLSGSNVTFDPTAGGAACYVPNTAQTFCFRSESYTNSWEYVYNNWLKFPSDWVVSNVYVQGSPVCNTGTWGSFSWSFQTSPYEVNISQSRYQSSTDHCTATYCVDLTPTGIANEGPTSWYFDGDGYGGTPHNPCSSDGYTPTGQNACDEMINPVAAVPICDLVPQVIITPEEITTSGCHAESQSQSLTITNITGAESTFAITYEIDFPGDVYGPNEITLANGASTEILFFLDPHICTEDADYTATVTVSDGSFSDQSTIFYKVYSQLNEWLQIPSNPIPFMDNVLADYDGKVWSITGYGSAPGVSYFEPGVDAWTSVAASNPPWGGQGYPRSGCQMGNEVFVYGDSYGLYTGLWSYNMDTNAWTSETPGGTPPPYTGIWAPSWVADTNTGLCYLTGGATDPGGGNLATVYVYDVITNTWLTELPAFAHVRDFHAAYLFMQPSNSQKLLCVAGGIDDANSEISSTQCYDFSTGLWRAENADLGVLPVSLWGMGYTQRMTADGEELWMVAGAYSLTPTNRTWFYDFNTGGWMDGGQLDTTAVYRTAAVTLNNEVYHVGGSAGSFIPTGNADISVRTTCPECVLPDLVKQAPAVAFPGQTIHYSITVNPMVSDVAMLTDYLPEFIEYVPDSLSVSPDIGIYYFDPDFNGIFWFYGGGSWKTDGWTPAATSGGSFSTELTTKSEDPSQLVRVKMPENHTNSVLWDQPLSTVDPAHYVNQEFTDMPELSAFLADDFIVTTSWMIDSIFVPGDGWNEFTTLANASALTFMIYRDQAGVPAGDPSGNGFLPVWMYSTSPTDPQITITTGSGGLASNTELVLNEPAFLPAGHYWLVFYPTMPFAGGGQFGRQPADTTNLQSALVINPGGGWGFGYGWQPWMDWWGYNSDMAFRIEGVEVPNLVIEFDANAVAPNKTIWNYAHLQYGSYIVTADVDTFTGYPIYLPMTIK